jgi:hypothetical protein
MDFYIYERWKICAVDLRIVSEQLTATPYFHCFVLVYSNVNIFVVSQDTEFLCAVTSLCDKERPYL